MVLTQVTKTRDCAYYGEVKAREIAADLARGEKMAADPDAWTYDVSLSDKPRLWVVRVYDETGAFIGYWK